MLLRAPPAVSPPSAAAASASSRSFPVALSTRKPRPRIPSPAARSGEAPANRTLMAGVVFEPFEEVKKELALVPSAPDQSLARHKYADRCEAAINEQINVEYNVSYAYHAMFAYFDRDNVALRGLAK